MKIVEGAEGPKAGKAIDYVELAKTYNAMKLKAAIEMSAEVYNITLFKHAIERRGLRSGVDFQAFNSKGKCYVKKLTETQMEG